MSNFISMLKEYSSLLKVCSVWENSKDILAPIVTDEDTSVATGCYIYEFYCYIRIIVDLRNSYRIIFKEGKGKTKYKFPQAAAHKDGKPLFLAYNDNNELEFQVCAGTKIDGLFDSEENHPDISFQLPTASENPNHADLILIMDAKFREDERESIPKAEVYKFGVIVDLFDLRGALKKNIIFDELKGLESNCLITNGSSYSNAHDTRLLKKYSIKEVEGFHPGKSFNIVG